MQVISFIISNHFITFISISISISKERKYRDTVSYHAATCNTILRVLHINNIQPASPKKYHLKDLVIELTAKHIFYSANLILYTKFGINRGTLTVHLTWIEHLVYKTAEQRGYEDKCLFIIVYITRLCDYIVYIW